MLSFCKEERYVKLIRLVFRIGYRQEEDVLCWKDVPVFGVFCHVQG